MNVQRIAKWTLAGFAVSLAAVVIGGYTMYRSDVGTNGLEAMQLWARMAPLPDSVSGLSVETRGGPFTREFTVRFYAPRNALNTWLEKSPGTRKLKPVVDGSTRTYNVEPGGGAMHAEVIVDDDVGSVSVHTFWS